ncbi:TonB-dependent receptor plug domain-containing protein [Sphingomonas sp. SFZ2018-12]|uniref:TonB-dependent receptor n=1 Tax=Sphingomonas sp. SFZ2018-12 TaxID=2683197 RepID=UPI001F108438|nr:TonB-dependent receptor [Sphingomonas sp. SFZ2018-12]MCH4894253.1 TonB-dependent receptor plug domain-containing protein [Sphingomonas sp. SFZ2018-12]
MHMPSRQLLLLLPLLAAAPAHAQTTPDDEQPEAERETILVTARRREEALQDVPVPISVFSERQLTSTGTYNISRIAQIQPVIQYYASNPRNSAINIRGLGAPLGLTNDGIEQGVGLYIDQVYYARPAASALDFIDTEQVEVLRGPQGTLYGKNTTAGAINIRTRAPSFSPEARVELSGGNYDFFQGKASVSGPFSETLAARLAIVGTTRRGTVRNVRTDEWTNSLDNLGLRGTLLYTGVEGLELTFAADWSRQRPDGYTQVPARVFPTLRAANRQFAALTAALGYALPTDDPFARITDVDADLRAQQDLGGASLVAEWQLGDSTLTSVTAWRFWTWRPSNDRDFIGLPITTRSENPSDQRQLTQEFRFATSGDNRVDFVAGLFGFRQTIDTRGLQSQGAAANLFSNGPTAGANPAVLDGLTQRNDIRFENNSVAAYGQLTWNLTDRLRLQPGLRLNYDTKDSTYDATVTGGIANPTPAQQAQQRAALPAQSYAGRYRDFNVSGDINLSWRPVDDVQLYAIYARGFKSGGLNLNGLPFRADGVTVATELVEVRPEQLDHFEIGAKTQFWDRRVTLNLTAFRTDIDDYQTTVTNGAIGVVRGYLANADVRIQGFEGELSLRPSDRIATYFNVAFNDGEFRDFPDAPPPPECTGITAATPNVPANCQGTLGGFKDISGERFPGISRWALAWGGEVNFPLGRGEIYAGADASYRSAFSSNATPSPFFVVDGYGIANFRVGYRQASGLNAWVWARNAFDTEYFEFLSNQPGNNGLAVGQLGDPATFGVTLANRF